MTESFVLLDQQYNAVTVGPGQYEVTLARPVELKAGAQAIISDCYVDSGVQAQGSFEFAEDVVLTFTFAYSFYDFTSPTSIGMRFLCNDTLNPNLATKTLSITVPAGVYAPTALAEFITTEVTKIPKFFYSTDTSVVATREWYPNNALFFPNTGAGALDVHQDSGNNNAMIGTGGLAGAVNVGTTEFALEYDVENRGIFEFTSLHRPILSGDNAAPCCVLRRYNGATGNFTVIPYVSNVMLWNLEPAWFWQSLGFDLTKICLVNLVDENGNISLDAFLACSTRAFLGTDAFNLTTSAHWNNIVPENNWPGTSTADLEILTNQVVSVQASSPPQFSNNGYYLVDLQLLPPRENTIADTQNLNASALVNKTFTSADGFAFNVSAITLSTTADMLISRARVSILSAQTRQPYTGLGQRNSVFVKIIN